MTNSLEISYTLKDSYYTLVDTKTTEDITHSANEIDKILQTICNDSEITLQEFNKRLLKLSVLDIQSFNSRNTDILKNTIKSTIQITNELISWNDKNSIRGFILEKEYNHKHKFISLQNNTIFKSYLLRQLNNIKFEKVIKNLEDLELLNETDLNEDFIEILYKLEQKKVLDFGRFITEKIIEDLKKNRPFLDEKSLNQHVEVNIEYYIKLLNQMKIEKNADFLKNLVHSLNIVEFEQSKEEEKKILIDQLIKSSELFVNYSVLINFIKDQSKQSIVESFFSASSTLNIDESFKNLFFKN